MTTTAPPNNFDYARLTAEWSRDRRVATEPSHFRSLLRDVQARAQEADALASAIEALRQDVAAADEAHAATVGPLQQQLERSDLPADERVAIRLRISSETEKLRQKIEEKNTQIGDLDRVLTGLRLRGTSIAEVESAAADTLGSPASHAREKVLIKLANIAQNLMSEYDRGGTPFLAEVADGIRDWQRSAMQERDELRAARIKLIYDLE